LIEVLADVFGIGDPDAGDLWPKVVARHAELFGDTPDDEIRLTP
jgi:hypothetical protein